MYAHAQEAVGFIPLGSIFALFTCFRVSEMLIWPGCMGEQVAQQPISPSQTPLSLP